MGSDFESYLARHFSSRAPLLRVSAKRSMSAAIDGRSLTRVAGLVHGAAGCYSRGNQRCGSEQWQKVPGAAAICLTRLSQLDPDLGNFADGLNGNWLIGLVRSRKNSGKAAAVPTK